MADTQDFTYIFGEKDDLLIVLFQGKIMGREIPLLTQCGDEILKKNQKIVIFACRDLHGFVPGAHATFAKIQKAVRDAGKIIGICSLNPEIKASLLLAGIVREAEIYDNIPQAWKELKARGEKS